MNNQVITFSLPRWRLTRWLLHAGHDVPDDIRSALVASLFGTLPIFAGGVVNTIAVSLVIALRRPTAPFVTWFVIEVILCSARLVLLLMAHRTAASGRRTPTDSYVLLAVLWGASVGYGAFVSILSGDWVAATLSCLSAAAMVGGICFRNFGAPRLVAVMILLSLGPCCPAGALSGQPVLLLVLIQIPFYLFAMSIAAFRLNKLLVSTMKAERENDRRARHDLLTGLPNRAGLVHAIDAMSGGLAPGAHRAAIFYLDLDGFKPVNDRYGHAAGDALLIGVSQRLRACVRACDVVARIGGDEFVLLVQRVKRADVPPLADSLIETVSQPFDLGHANSIRISASIGVALVPDHGEDIDTILKAGRRRALCREGAGQDVLGPRGARGARVMRRSGRPLVSAARVQYDSDVDT